MIHIITVKVSLSRQIGCTTRGYDIFKEIHIGIESQIRLIRLDFQIRMVFGSLVLNIFCIPEKSRFEHGFFYNPNL